jgi:MFS family permease
VRGPPPSSLLKAFSGTVSDRVGNRKGLAVAGYAISTLAKPGFALASSWVGIGLARWGDRVGKGIRTAPRDALVAESIDPAARGFAFGLHRAADTAGAVVGLVIAIAVVGLLQARPEQLEHRTFQILVVLSLVPAATAVLALAFGAKEVPRSPALAGAPRRVGFTGLGRGFLLFLGISALFDLGNFSDAFLLLRAQERGLTVTGILWTLVGFNLVYATISVPAGRLSDRVGRGRVLVAGWLLYAVVRLGFALVDESAQVVALFVAYGACHALTAGAGRALIADLVPRERRGTAYGSYYAVLGLLDLPASVIAGVLWQGVGPWAGFGPGAPFLFGAATAGLAALLLALSFREGRPGG